MEYRVVITSDAEADLDGFLRYLLLKREAIRLPQIYLGKLHLTIDFLSHILYISNWGLHLRMYT